MKNGCYFIDRNSKRFSCILDYLRTGELILDDLGVSIKAVHQEAVYFGLTSLEELCLERETQLKKVSMVEMKPKKRESLNYHKTITKCANP